MMSKSPVMTVTDELIAELEVFVLYGEGTDSGIKASEVEALLAERAELKHEISEYRAARIAYASEFPLNIDGDPDVGNIHANIRALKRDAGRYKFLRENPCADVWVDRHELSHEYLDASIDSAMESEK